MPICLWCSYDLTGLPEHHACPECGLEYDPQATAIELAQAIHPLAIVFFAAAFAALMAALTLVPEPQWFYVFVAVIAGGFILPMLGRMWLGSGRHDRLILNCSGLNYCPSSGETRTMPWEQVAEVTAGLTNASLTVLDPNGEQLLKLRAARLGGPKHVPAAVEEIRRSRVQYMN
jgi:hypothetical protein